MSDAISSAFSGLFVIIGHEPTAVPAAVSALFAFSALLSVVPYSNSTHGQSKSPILKKIDTIATSLKKLHAIEASVLNIKTEVKRDGRKEVFYLTTHSTHYIYSYMASGIW